MALLVTSILIDLVLCFIYCSIRKAKLRNEMAAKKQDNSGSDAEHEVSKTKTGLKRMISLIYKKYRQVMDCVLRLNLFIVGYIPSHHVRDFLYKRVFRITMKHHSIIYYGAEIRAPWNITIGEGSIVGDRAILDGRNGLRIGANVNISSRASIWTMQHDVNDPYFSTGGVHCY